MWPASYWRLSAGHPQLSGRRPFCRQQARRAGRRKFPAFAKRLPGANFNDLDDIGIAQSEKHPRSSLFSAAPHGVAAGIIDRLRSAAEGCGRAIHCVDISR